MAAIIIIGLSAGVIAGLLGIGGGVVLVPALILILGIPTNKAIGISMAVIVPTAIVGTFRHHQLGHVDYKFALLLAIGAMIGAYAGASLTDLLSGPMLKRAFGVFVIFVGLNMIFDWTTKVAADGVSIVPEVRVGEEEGGIR